MRRGNPVNQVPGNCSSPSPFLPRFPLITALYCIPVIYTYSLKTYTACDVSFTALVSLYGEILLNGGEIEVCLRRLNWTLLSMLGNIATAFYEISACWLIKSKNMIRIVKPVTHYLPNYFQIVNNSLTELLKSFEISSMYL